MAAGGVESESGCFFNGGFVSKLMKVESFLNGNFENKALRMSLSSCKVWGAGERRGAMWVGGTPFPCIAR